MTDDSPTLDEIRASTATILTITDVAALLDVDERTVRRACEDGQLPSVRVGRRILIPREQLLAVLDRPSGPTLSEIRDWPATVDVRHACSALGISTSWGYELVKRGEFPCKVLTIRNRSRVITASLVVLLEGFA